MRYTFKGKKDNNNNKNTSMDRANKAAIVIPTDTAPP